MTDAIPRPWRIPGAVTLSQGTAPPLQAPVVLAANVQVAPVTSDDAADLLAFEQENRACFERWINPRISAFYSYDGVAAAIDEAVREAQQDLGYQFLVRVDGRLAGRVNLKHALRPYFNKVELGYRMGQHDAGKGYATQAVARVLGEAFDVLRFSRVEATIRGVNSGSLRVLEKNGFRVYGRSERSVQFNGAWYDLQHWCLERGRWVLPVP